jgi:hypothetical protein
MFHYTYVNHHAVAPVCQVGSDNRIYALAWVPMTMELMIDPRGRLLNLRIAAIRVLDRLAKYKFIRPKAVNLCEFLAAYPS